MRQLTKYVPGGKNQRTIMSGMQLGLLRAFHKKGVDYTVAYDEAHLLDQRSFGPAVARGLLAFDQEGDCFYLSDAGHVFLEEFETKKPWKEHPSKEFSSYIDIAHMVHRAQNNKPRKRRAA